MASLTPLATVSPFAIDWASLGWVFLLGALTFACMTVRARFPVISQAGAFPTVLAHVVIGYFSLGMLAFGGAAVVQGYFPVPGGLAWSGPVALIGGLAAMTIGGGTLAEHLLQVRALRRERATEAVTIDD